MRPETQFRYEPMAPHLKYPAGRSYLIMLPTVMSNPYHAGQARP